MRTVLQGMATIWALGLIVLGVLYPILMVQRLSAAAYPGYWETEAEQAAARLAVTKITDQGFAFEMGLLVVSGVIILVLSRLLRPAPTP